MTFKHTKMFRDHRIQHSPGGLAAILSAKVLQDLNRGINPFIGPQLGLNPQAIQLVQRDEMYKNLQQEVLDTAARKDAAETRLDQLVQLTEAQRKTLLENFKKAVNDLEAIPSLSTDPQQAQSPATVALPPASKQGPAKPRSGSAKPASRRLSSVQPKTPSKAGAAKTTPVARPEKGNGSRTPGFSGQIASPSGAQGQPGSSIQPGTRSKPGAIHTASVPRPENGSGSRPPSSLGQVAPAKGSRGQIDQKPGPKEGLKDGSRQKNENDLARKKGGIGMSIQTLLTPRNPNSKALAATKGKVSKKSKE